MMKVVQKMLVGLCAGSVAACSSLPGLKYQSGGSNVWKGDQASNAVKPLQIKEITPDLTLEMARQSLKKSALPSPVQTAGTAAPWIYHVGVGDVLSVIVWDHPELTNPAGTTQNVESSGRVIRSDGSIFYPHVGNVQVVGKTTEEISKLLSTALAPVIQSPQVDVSVLHYRSQFVRVVGDVDRPCKVPVTNTPITVIDVLSDCQSIRPDVGQRDVELDRGGVRRTVDLFAIYQGHDPLQTQPLHGGDILYMKDDRWNRVFVVGEVNKQAAISIPVSGLSLADALNNDAVGGLNQESVDTKDIYVFRGGVSEADLKGGQLDRAVFQPQVYHMNLGSADALLLADQFQLQPRDVVFASTSSLVSYSRAVNLIFPTFSTLVETGLLLQSTR